MVEPNHRDRRWRPYSSRPSDSRTEPRQLQVWTQARSILGSVDREGELQERVRLIILTVETI